MTDNKLTDEQIERAFEICYGIDKVVGCTFCPLYDEEDFCQRGDVPLEEQFFDVYTRQKAEKEALINAQETLQKHIAEQKAEIERLQKENKTIRYCYQQAKSYNNSLAESCEKNCKKFNMITRAEARKEFWHKLKQKKKWDIDMPDHIYVSDGDNLLKEMEGE